MHIACVLHACCMPPACMLHASRMHVACVPHACDMPVTSTSTFWVLRVTKPKNRSTSTYSRIKAKVQVHVKQHKEEVHIKLWVLQGYCFSSFLRSLSHLLVSSHFSLSVETFSPHFSWQYSERRKYSSMKSIPKNKLKWCTYWRQLFLRCCWWTLLQKQEGAVLGTTKIPLSSYPCLLVQSAPGPHTSRTSQNHWQALWEGR